MPGNLSACSPLVDLKAETGRSGTPETAEQHGFILSVTFLCKIFLRCDALRFSGTGIIREELLGILYEIQKFIDVLYEAERKRNLRQKAGANRCSSPNLMGGTA